jgi:hypothetical protein
LPVVHFIGGDLTSLQLSVFIVKSRVSEVWTIGFSRSSHPNFLDANVSNLTSVLKLECAQQSIGNRQASTPPHLQVNPLTSSLRMQFHQSSSIGVSRRDPVRSARLLAVRWMEPENLDTT